MKGNGMGKDVSTNFWTALTAIVGLCGLLGFIVTAQTTDFIKEIAFTITLVGVLCLYIQFVVLGRVSELEKYLKSNKRGAKK